MGPNPAQIAERTAEIDNDWGSGALSDIFLGEAADTPGTREWVGKIQRSMHMHTMAGLTWQALMNVDIRGVLQDIRTPTLVLARPDDQLAPPEAAAALAAGIRGAQFRILPPGAHNTFDILDLVGAHVVEFACDTRSAAPSERVLTTVVFTDIVGSTEQLTTAGDAHWRSQLDAHDQLVDAMLPKYSGRRAKHTGDGVFALFDGPTSAAQCALELVPALAVRGIRIRVGIHVGECEKRGEEWSDMAVHTGARIGSLAGPGEILASRTVRDLSAGSGMFFEHLGTHRRKGGLHRWRVGSDRQTPGQASRGWTRSSPGSRRDTPRVSHQVEGSGAGGDDELQVRGPADPARLDGLGGLPNRDRLRARRSDACPPPRHPPSTTTRAGSRHTLSTRRHPDRMTSSWQSARYLTSNLSISIRVAHFGAMRRV